MKTSNQIAIRRLLWQRQLDGSFIAETAWLEKWKIYQENKRWIGIKGKNKCYNWSNLENLIIEMDLSYSRIIKKAII